MAKTFETFAHLTSKACKLGCKENAKSNLQKLGHLVRFVGWLVYQWGEAKRLARGMRKLNERTHQGIGSGNEYISMRAAAKGI